MARKRLTRQPSSVAAGLAPDAERADVLKDALERLELGGVDVGRVVAILKKARTRARYHAEDEFLNRIREVDLLERDRACQDVNKAVTRLSRWMDKSMSPESRNPDTIRFTAELAGASGVSEGGRVVLALHELQEAMKAWSLLSVAREDLPPTRRAQRGRPRATWVAEARAELKELGLDQTTIADLLWGFGLSRSAPLPDDALAGPGTGAAADSAPSAWTPPRR